MLRTLKTHRVTRFGLIRQGLLILSMLLAVSISTAHDAAADPADQTDPAEPPVDFAPGATGAIDAPLARILREGRALGEALAKDFAPQEPADGAFADIDFGAMRERALNDPRVRALLGAGSEATGSDGQGAERYEGGTLFVLASFAMPAPSLRQLMEEAKSLDVPVIIRGFVNNSVYDTQAAMIETFGSLEDAAGFVIDPTIFERFDVTAVPQVIGAGSTLDQCETPGCADDPVPPHDVVRGNVPLTFALQLIADEGEHAGEAARRTLKQADRRTREALP